MRLKHAAGRTWRSSCGSRFCSPIRTARNRSGGLARDLKLIGSDKATDALNRLRKVNPNDPNIAKIEALASTRAETAQLRQAGELARQGKVDDAMRIYKRLYGDHPPDGDIALAYYQTLYGTASGKQQA